jgi:hypothetical protein
LTIPVNDVGRIFFGASRPIYTLREELPDCIIEWKNAQMFANGSDMPATSTGLVIGFPLYGTIVGAKYQRDVFGDLLWHIAKHLEVTEPLKGLQ